MKTVIQNLLAAVVIAISLQTHAQGTLVYDQQSASAPISPIGNGSVDGFYIQTEPLTQSFVPELSSIGFVQFEFEDLPVTGNKGATVCVNLWTGSPNIRSATLVSSTTPVYMPSGFVSDNLVVAGVTSFYFPSPVALTAGQTYYLQPVVLSGDNPWTIVVLTNTYPNGKLYGSGYAEQPDSDLWFREGVSVPEPTSLGLVGLAGFLILARKRRHISLVILTMSLISFSPPIASAQRSNFSGRSEVSHPLPADLQPVPSSFPMNRVTTWYSLQRWDTGFPHSPENWLARRGVEAPALWSPTHGYNTVWLDENLDDRGNKLCCNETAQVCRLTIG